MHKMHYLIVIIFYCFPILLVAQLDDLQVQGGTITPRDFTFTDVDLDGDLDLLEFEEVEARTNAGARLRWRENVGSGTVELGSQRTLLQAAGPAAVQVIADFNGDDRSDMLVAGVSQRELLLSVPSTTSYELVQLSAATYPLGTSYYAADWDGDGVDDLTSEYNGNWTVRKSSNGITSPLLSTTEEPSGDQETYLADFDGDGNTDIIYLIDETIYYYRYTGNFTFDSPVVQAVGISLGVVDYLAFADFNGDGRLDLLYDDTDGNTVSSIYYRLQTSGHTFAAPILFLPDTRLIRTWRGNFTHPSVESYIFAVAQNNTGSYRHYRYAAAQNTLVPTDSPALEGLSTTASPVYFKDPIDFDGDAIDDFLLLSGAPPFNNDYRIFYSTGSNDPFQLDPVAINWRVDRDTRLHLVDMDNDGFQELTYVTRNAVPKQLWVADGLQPDQMLLKRAATITVQGSSISFPHLNDDGYPDCILGSFSSDPGNLWAYYLNDGQGNLLPDTLIDNHPFIGDNFRSIYTDLDEDGDEDLLRIDANTGDVLQYLNTDGYFQSFTVLFNLQPDYLLQDIDFNQDGRTDLLVYSSNDARVALRQPDGTFTAPAGVGSLPDADLTYNFAPETTQLTSDEFPDVIFRNSTGLILLQNTTGVPAAAEGALLLDEPYLSDFATADIDDDGQDELLTTDQFGMLKSHELLQDGTLEASLIGNFGRNLSYPHTEVPITVARLQPGRKGQLLINSSDNSNGSSHLYYYSFGEEEAVVAVKVFLDEDGNGELDTGEPGLVGIPVLYGNENIQRYTNASGYTRFYDHTAAYHVSLPVPAGYTLTTPGTFSGTFDFSTPDTLYFGLEPTDPIAAISADITTGSTRCSFVVPLWTTIRNAGTTNGQPTATFRVDSRVQVAQVPPGWTSQGDTTWVFETTDAWSPTQKHTDRWELQMPAADESGSTLFFELLIAMTDSTGVVLATADAAATPVLTCAYDPNDKLVNLEYIDYDEYLQENPMLEYTIRFQNTGNDTAFTVRLEDQLGSRIDRSSFQPLSSSHDYDARLSAEGLIIFLFEDILLPDTATNFVASQGYIKFRIGLKENLSTGIVIENEANIFFDFNPPILTNKAFTALGPTSVNRNSDPIYVSLFPNPTSCDFTLNITAPARRGSIRITDIYGRTVHSGQICGNCTTTTITTEQWSAGLYLVTYYTGTRYVSRRLVVK